MKKFVFLICLFVLVPLLQAQVINTTLNYSVNLPAKLDGKNPVLILLHGYGSNESDLFDLAKAFDSRFITFSLRAPIAVSESGFCWYHLQSDDSGVRKYKYAEAIASREQILYFITSACRAFNLDSNNVFLLGFSQGAIMSYDLFLSAPSKIKGIMALSGRMMDETTKVNSDFVKLSKHPVFIAHGLSDNVINISESEKTNQFFKSHGLQNITFKKYEMPHSINGAELNDLKSWLSTALK